MDSNPPANIPNIAPLIQTAIQASGPMFAQLPFVMAQVKQQVDLMKANGSNPFDIFGGGGAAPRQPTSKGFLAQSLKLSSPVISPDHLSRICAILDGLIFENAASPEVQELIRLVEASVQMAPAGGPLHGEAKLVDIYRDDSDLIIEYIEQMQHNSLTDTRVIEQEISLLLSELGLLQYVTDISTKERLLHVCMSYCIFAATDCTNHSIFSLAQSLTTVKHNFAYGIAVKILRNKFVVKGKHTTAMILNNDGTVVYWEHTI